MIAQLYHCSNSWRGDHAEALIGPTESQGALGACYDEGRPLVHAAMRLRDDHPSRNLAA